MKIKSFSLSLITVSMLSGYAHASPIPGIDDAYFKGADEYVAYDDPATACDIFNAKVAYINNHLEQQELPGKISNLCQHARIEDGQIEEQFIITSQNGAYHYGEEDYKIREQIDVARTIDLLMFSQSNKTNYIMAVDGSMNVTRQTLADGGYYFEWIDEEVAPHFWYGEGYMGQMFHGNSQFNFMSGENAYRFARKKAVNEAPNDVEEQSRLTWKYLAEECENDKGNDYCLPQNRYGNLFVNQQSFPSSSNVNKEISLAESTSFSFDITGTFEASKSDGPSAGLSVGFGFSQTKESSQTHSMLNYTSVDEGNDIGHSVVQTINTRAVGEAGYYADNPSSEFWHVQNAAEIWGEDLYRVYDLKSYETWQENYTSDWNTCQDQKLVFGNAVTVSRAYLNTYGDNWTINENESKLYQRESNYGITIDTDCIVDDKGQTFRVMKETIL
ncbi:excinuclease ABC subunit B [Vibrio campbellii]|uniref:Excinuclease ABC subunit B n=1 Tax=Vibrio campbellii TaxID=680 RepID=A0AAE9SNC0_9VIBR|nr:excinuclease ABC subunit B [Vibrio campbellii]UTZ27488.1 excinuclease ABC subunit B [Vibrio campbellii]